MKPNLQKAPIGVFTEHPAQMRTLYQLDDMASLTLQVYENDLDEWQPIVATPDNKGGYFIISGHRRRMARLFAYGLEAWVNHPDSPINPDDGVHIELVKEFIGTLVDKYEYVDAAAEVLTSHYANEEIEFVLFEGNEKAQILALQRANYGMIKPDMLGIAHSFQAALEAGASVAEIARNAGQHYHYVRNHLALTKIPQELAEQIADGHLAMSIGIAVANISNEQKRHGLALFVLSNPPEQLTAKAVKEVAKKLSSFHGLQVPLTTAHQAQRNIARSLTRLWHLVVEAYPVRSWAVIASFIYQGVNYQTPWEDEKAVDTWFKTMGGEHYYGEEGVKWESVVTNLMGEVSCDTCPVAKLPERQLRSDLSPGRSDVLGMPCRSGRMTPCLHGLAEGDPFHVRVPWDWAENVGVEKDASGYVVLSSDALQKAWQTQAALEDAEANGSASGTSQTGAEITTKKVAVDRTAENASEEVAAERVATQEVAAEPVAVDTTAENASEEVAVDTIATGEVAVDAVATEKMATGEVAAERVATGEVAASQVATQEVATQEQKWPVERTSKNVTKDRSAAQAHSPSPIDSMRAQIANFIKQHVTMNVDHPFATPCSKCQHQLTSSPTDESALHCTWARQQHVIKFLKLNPAAGKPIPICRQFAPKNSWANLIPAHPQKAIMPREWIKHQIEQVVNKQQGGTCYMFEFLTGRPMNSLQAHRGWFLDQLDIQGGSLSNEQLWTLMVWALAESARLEKQAFLIPADSLNRHFIKVSEVEFT
ncbi:MAG: hypothetical protein ACPGWR_02430 [Ardenticatenaceae bacterium]